MGETVDVTIPVDARVAAALEREGMRTWVGMIVSRMLRPADPERLERLLDEAAAEARRRGLTDELLEAELAAYNAERRERLP